ncbi:cell surface protein SprA [uncultured Muribaculum sp.]|uniref:T9SS outer membrane translocon Sov/SprA n=1 Tax=uncultured Muribaculum sp. TaxID=1918613 RepID=UPI00262ABDA6|nr:cell surface protein SprA [uncultured Muribaculum sp.]
MKSAKGYRPTQYTTMLFLAVVVAMLLWGVAIPRALASPQYRDPAIMPPPPPSRDIPVTGLSSLPDSSGLPVLTPTIPPDYQALAEDELAADLSTPSNIRTEVEYDIESGCYIVRTKVGEFDIATPFMLTPEQYNQLQLRRSMQQYFNKRNGELVQGVKDKEPFNVLDMNFALGPLEKIFGPGGVKLKTTGSVQMSMGVKSNKTDNPALSLTARRRTYFDFDQKIQANVNASVGDRMKFGLNYNTDATFDFDSKNITLAYEGKEDDIVKSIEAGNVSMTTGSSLIRGSSALFGIKSTLQFGKLTATALVSQQNSESRSVSTKGGVQTTKFSVNADQYDQNRHFFLAHFFRDNYDTFASKLPYVASGVKITRIEVWVTNKSGNYNQSRNIVSFMDLGESQVLASDYWRPNPAVPNPSNTSNALLEIIKTEYPGARNINTVTQALDPLQAFGIEGGRDFEKVESARLLQSSEYTLNSTLGYISLKTALNADEVLGVAYEYTYRGQVYQVGEFSADITTSSDALFVKMLKNTTTSPRVPMWKLMMKNVYSLGAYQVEKSNFRLNIKYLSDTTGTQINYLPVPGLTDKPLLQVMNLDRLDSNQEGNPDGFFDFIEGYTVLASSGKIIFPVAEPFGSHLEKSIGNPVIAENYTYPELYDSTLVVARQFAHKNKYVISGEYQASGGSQIRLNAMNVPRGSVVVMAGGVRLTENSDYTVDYAMGVVTITNQSIIDSGQSISVTLENQSMFNLQRKTLLGLDLNYKFSKDFNLGATIMHFSEKALTEKVNIGDETVNNTMFGINLAYNTRFMWLTNLLNKIPTVNATQPSTLSIQAEAARLQPHKQKSGSNKGSSYVDDFESTQTGIDLRSPYAWSLASTPYQQGNNALFPEAALSNNVDYGKNRALLAWYYIDRMFTQRNSSLCPGYIASDLKQLSNPYVREVTSTEIFPDRQLAYGESNLIQTLNLSFYPTERGPYNLDAVNIDDQGNLMQPEKRWGGIMRRLDNTNFEQANIEYVQFWLLNPFLDPDNPNTEGGDFYINFGEVSEDILKDGLKSYENGIPYDGNNQFLEETVWGRVSRQNSLTYAFDNNAGSRLVQDVGLDGLKNDEEFTFSSYSDYLDGLRRKLAPDALDRMYSDQFSPFNDPAGDNYHFYRGYDYDERRLGVLERYKRYNGVEGNSLSPSDAPEPLYQSARTGPDVEDINQDNTLNEYERYFQYKVSLRPEDLVVGKNYITDKQVSPVICRDGSTQMAEWYQFKIPLSDYERVVGSINDFSTVRFMRMFMTGFKATTHLRFATLELVRGEWRPYDFSLNTRGDSPAEGELDISVVNIEENAGREPVNYVLPPGVTRATDPGQSQILQLNEQSMSLKVLGLQAGDARAVYRNTQHDLRNYKRLQMWVHAESLIENVTNLRSGELSIFLRLGSDVKNNYYEYEIPLTLTPHKKYAQDNVEDRYAVWPLSNRFDFALQELVNLKKERNRAKHDPASGVGYTTLFTGRDPDNESNRMAVMGNPSLSDVRVMMIGVRNNASTARDGIVWVNELKVTDFDESGGWAAKANVNLGVSDIATLNFGTHIETAGFGGVDQPLNARRMDDYRQFNFAVQADMGRFFPEKLKLKAPVYYSVSNETTLPKYNPLDQDVLLKDALDEAATKAERDSIRDYAIEKTTIKSFSISGLQFDRRSEKPMPWDPANFVFNFSFNKRHNTDPTTEYENTNDYRGSLQYSWSPYLKGLKPFGWMKSKNRNLKFFKEWEVNYLPSNISFLTTMSRYYYEQQTRSEVDQMMKLPVAVSKNFLWDRQLNLTWNLTKQLTFNFSSNTSARIEEPVGAVNRRLFPDRYKEWRDTVIRSILHLGTPWAYNQTFTANYKAPFSRIPVVDFLTGSVTYNATYRWDRGATVDGEKVGNTIANQGAWNFDGRINLEGLYNKFSYLKKINQRFSSSKRPTAPRKAKRFERTFKLNADTSLVIRHNLRNRKVKVTAATTDGKPFPVSTRVKDLNTVEVLTRGDQNIKFTVIEVLKDDKSIWREIGEHATRFAMLTRSVNIRYRTSHSMSLPLFGPDIGNVFGQSRSYGPMSPGLDFAFGFSGEDYVVKAKERGWLMIDDNQTSPSIWSTTNEFNLDIDLEPVRGLKIKLTNNRTDNHSSQVQFMYADMPTTRSGSYTKTHCALRTALRTSRAEDGYNSAAFNQFLENIPVIARRIEARYAGTTYPTGGFMADNPNAGRPFSTSVGEANRASSDVLIPAFIAAYTGVDARKIYLTPFPKLADMLPNWRVTYDGLIRIGRLSNIFKTITLNHAYQCTYTVGSYGSYLNWMQVGRGDMGFVPNADGAPIPSSPYNISTVSITEKFAPLIGVAVTLKNELKFNAEYRDGRTLTLNSDAGQLVEANTRNITAGVGYKIVGFNTVLKMRGSGQGISNDLTINADFSYQQTQALIRRIETNYTQATSGTRTIGFNLSASYVMSRRMTISAYIDHQVNTPLISSSAYPTTNSNYGITFNLNLAR